MSKPLWQERFPELSGSTESLEELLLSGKIPEASYIEWASETFQIPSLDTVFFRQLKNFKLLLENPSPEWNKSFFPVHEWQGMLYIACLAPQATAITKKHCFVLGSYRSMVSIWEKMEKPASLATPAATAAPKHPAYAAHAPRTAPAPTPAAPKAPPVAQAPAPTTPPPLASEVPSWLPTTETPVASDADDKTDPFGASIVIPLGQLNNIMDEASRTVRLGELKENSIVKEKTKTGINVNPNLSQANFKIPEITNVFRMGAPKEMSFTTTKTIMPFPDTTKDFTFIRTVYSDQVIVEAHGKVQDNKDPQEALISAFKVLKDYYKKLMWIVRDQKGRAFPIACNDAWAFNDDAWNTAINFKDANPFRLAKFTQKPFHGQVFQNSVNDQYFKIWNGNKYPDIMTIIPVKMGGKVFGYFVGCDRGTHFHNQQTLEIMESVCNELVSTFVRIHQELSVRKPA